MNALEYLLDRRWVLKATDRELYYNVKDNLSEYSSFLSEKLGYHVIANQYLIKLEKIPANPESWMGIQDFREPMEYVFLCLILMFLEEKEPDDQFTLSGITEYVESRWKESKIDWTSYRTRKSFVNVLKFCEKNGLFLPVDGEDEMFAKNEGTDVLYDNTGASRYFMRNFARDISGFTDISDFEKEEWMDMDENRGVIRRQRVYRQLLLSYGIRKTENNEEDFSYVKNFRNVIQNDFSNVFPCMLQIYRNNIFLVLEPECRTGRCFPEDKTLSDIALLCGRIITEKIKSGEIVLGVNEEIKMSREGFAALLEECKERYQGGFLKGYREMTMGEFCRECTAYMEGTGLVQTDGSRVVVSGVFGKIIGGYPKDFKLETE